MKDAKMLATTTVRQSFDVVLEQSELILRMVEAELQLSSENRIPGMSAQQVLLHMREAASAEVKGLIDSCVTFSTVAMHFFSEALVAASNVPGAKATAGLDKIENEETRQ